MILDLLDRSGIKGNIEGEHLQGLEKLELGGFLRITVDDADYEKAKKVIGTVDIGTDSPDTVHSTPVKDHSWQYGIIGFIAGSALVAFIYYIPIVVEKHDLNRDGEPDGKSVYFGNRISSTELDRNFDGRVDEVFKYNNQGFVKSSKSDYNFDGIFETETEWKNGNPQLSKSDTTGDGFQDYIVTFNNGVIDTISFISPKTKKPIKVQQYDGMKLISANVDTNRDGNFDKFFEYDEIEEIINTKK